MIDEKDIKRINFLAKKQRETGLDDAETEEQKILRRKYIDAMKSSLIGQLENLTIIDSDGTKRKVKRK